MTDPVPAWFHAAVAAPYDERTVDVDGAAIRYLRWGIPADPGLILVHGGSAHAHWWSFIAPQLHNYHVLALDLSGHGDSGRRESYPLEGWADEVMAVADDAGVEGLPLVVGHSMGGIVAIVAAARFGERLAGTVIVDSPVRRPDPERVEGATGRAFRNPKTYEDLETAVEHFRLIPAQPTENGFILDYIARRSLRLADGRWEWKFDPNVFRWRQPAAIHEYLADIRVRVAILKGELSDLVTPDVSDYMYEALGRNAPIVEIPQAYHHLIIDQPLAFIAALRAILADWEHSTPRRRR